MTSTGNRNGVAHMVAKWFTHYARLLLNKFQLVSTWSHTFYQRWIIQFFLFFNYLLSLSFQSPLTKYMCLFMQNLFNLTLSRRRPLLYRNQSIDLDSKSMDWFLYDNSLRHEKVKQDTLLPSSLTSLNNEHVNLLPQALKSFFKLTDSPLGHLVV